MIEAARRALEQLFAPEFRTVLFKALGLTVALFVALWFALQALITMMAPFPYPWLETLAGILAGAGLLIALAFLMGPITALFAGLFLDEVAEAVEQRYYGAHRPGTEVPMLQSMGIALRFLGVILLVNLCALLLILIPGVNAMVFLVGNGYLLGREYFELAGLRHLAHSEVKDLRKRNRGLVFVAGLALAFLATVPFVNLLLPLFATAFMVHIFKSVHRPR